MSLKIELFFAVSAGKSHPNTRGKTAMLYLRIIVLFTLRTLLKAIICCLQLNTQSLLGWRLEGGLLVIDAVG